MKIRIILIALIFIASCDQVTSKYSTFQDAQKSKLFDKGWIPKQLTNENIADIYLQTNIDLNTFIFSFKTNKGVLNECKKGELISINEIQRIDIPEWWIEEINNHPIYHLNQLKNKRISLVYNYKTEKLYGWGKSE